MSIGHLDFVPLQSGALGLIRSAQLTAATQMHPLPSSGPVRLTSSVRRAVVTTFSPARISDQSFMDSFVVRIMPSRW